MHQINTFITTPIKSLSFKNIKYRNWANWFTKFASFLDNSASKWCQKPEINTVKFHSENSHLKNEKKKDFPQFKERFLGL